MAFVSSASRGNNPVKGRARSLFIPDRNYGLAKYLADADGGSKRILPSRQDSGSEKRKTKITSAPMPMMIRMPRQPIESRKARVTNTPTGHGQASQPTRCWREMDSNHRYPVGEATFRKHCRILLTHDEDCWDDRRFPEHRNPGLVIVPGATGDQTDMISGLWWMMLLSTVLDLGAGNARH
jgi:hypothetical protein